MKIFQYLSKTINKSKRDWYDWEKDVAKM